MVNINCTEPKAVMHALLSSGVRRRFIRPELHKTAELGSSVWEAKRVSV